MVKQVPLGGLTLMTPPNFPTCFAEIILSRIVAWSISETLPGFGSKCRLRVSSRLARGVFGGKRAAANKIPKRLDFIAWDPTSAQV
jgi:hypothetical protein